MASWFRFTCLSLPDLSSSDWMKEKTARQFQVFLRNANSISLLGLIMFDDVITKVIETEWNISHVQKGANCVQHIIYPSPPAAAACRNSSYCEPVE